jgi:ribonuclease BN (tRNA processing enzyme)
MTHFSPASYNTLEKRKEAEKIARKIFPNTIAATDDLVFEI